MPMNTDQLKMSVRGDESAGKPSFALVLVLEDALVNGYQIAYEVLRNLLPPPSRDTFTPTMFVRNGGDAVTRDFIGSVADSFELDALTREQLIADFAKSFSERVVAEAGTLPAGLGNWLEAVQARNGISLAVSTLPEMDALAVMDKITGADVRLTFERLNESAKVHLAKKLIRLSRKLDIPPTRMLMVAVGPMLARSAVEAGYNCVAVPNDLTAHADFPGCMFVLEKFTELSGAELLEGVFPSLTELGK